MGVNFTLLYMDFQYFDAFPLSHLDYYHCFKGLFNFLIHFEQIVTYVDTNPEAELTTERKTQD